MMMWSLIEDVRYSIRSLRRSPGFVALAALTLALGVGATSAIFSMVNSMLYKPLPVERTEGLVRLTSKRAENPYFSQFAYPNFRDVRSSAKSFESMVAWVPFQAGLATDEFSIKASGAAVSGEYFEFLGVRALHGRMIRPDEDGPEGAHPVVVLGYDYWQTQFGGDTEIVGREILLNNAPYEVVGICPQGFRGTEWAIDVPLYAPMAMAESLGNNQRELRVDNNHRVLARLAPGVSIEQAQAETETILAGLREKHPVELGDLQMRVIPETRTRPDPSMHEVAPTIARIFMGLVVLVVLIACFNIANLFLSRGLDRRREVAVRLALGASRFRVVRQLMIESLMVALVGGAGALAIAAWAAEGLSAIRLPTSLPIYFDFVIDGRVFAFNAAIALVSALLFGLLPALRASRPNIQGQMKDGGRSMSVGREGGRLRAVLVTAQFAVSLVLLVVAGLFLRSLQEAGSIYLGFRPEGRLMATVSPEVAGYDAEESTAVLKEAVEKARSIPGVASAAVSYGVPFGFSSSALGVFREGYQPTETEGPTSVRYNVVGPDFFETVGTDLVSGRGLVESDAADSPAVAVVNETLAQRLWPGEDPVGKRMTESRDGSGPWISVVGLVPTGKYEIMGEAPTPYMFVPWAQRPRSEMRITLLAEDGVEAAALAEPLREAIREINSVIAVYDVRTLDDHVWNGKAMLPVRLAAALIGSMAALGLLLAAVGVYASLSQWVAKRTNEIGVRMALGADRGRVVRLVLRGGLTLAAVGLALGGVLAYFAGGFVEALIFVSPTDLAAFVAAPVVLAAVALVACYLPARRASAVEPIAALRYE